MDSTYHGINFSCGCNGYYLHITEKNTFIAFLLGAFGYILGFYFPAYLYYCIMFNYDAVGLFFYIIAHVLIYIIFIPVILLFNKFFRILSQNQGLETLLFYNKSAKQ